MSKGARSDSQFEVSNRLREIIVVVTVQRQNGAVLNNHVLGADGAQGVNDKPTCGALDAENLALADLAWEVGASGAVVVEKAVQASTVDRQILSVDDAQTESVAVPGLTVGVSRVVEGSHRRVWSVSDIRVGLVVSTGSPD